MVASAYIGLGIQIQMADTLGGSKTTIAKVFDISATPKAKYDQVDSSTYDQGNPFRQFIAGLADGGQFTFDMNFLPNSATDLFLRSKRGLSQYIFITFPDGSTYNFPAVIMEYGWDKAPIDGKLTASCDCKVSGDVTPGAASAPVNAILPSIAGSTLVNGATFTGDVGQWFPSGTSYTYRWLRDGVAIGGATAGTYTTVGADVGHGIQFEVTAINATGSTVATSLKTGDIS